MASRRRRRTHRHGIIRKSRTAGGERIEYQAWGRMLGLADREADRALCGIGYYAGEQRAQTLERIGLQQRKTGIHAEDAVQETNDYMGRRGDDSGGDRFALGSRVLAAFAGFADAVGCRAARRRARVVGLALARPSGE